MKNALRGAVLLAVSFWGLATAAATDLNTVLRLAPKKPVSLNETHAALAISSKRISGAYHLSGRAKVVAQFRANPNAWEAAWILWNYQDDTHFYYFTLKVNGWELGKRDPNYPGGQRFLATGPAPALKIGAWYSFDVAVIGAQMMVSIDGAPVAIFSDTEAPLYTAGRVGLYTEDADVRFAAVGAPEMGGFGAPASNLSNETPFGDWQLASLQRQGCLRRQGAGRYLGRDRASGLLSISGAASGRHHRRRPAKSRCPRRGRGLLLSSGRLPQSLQLSADYGPRLEDARLHFRQPCECVRLSMV